jgi:hypothetical protein
MREGRQRRGNQLSFISVSKAIVILERRLRIDALAAWNEIRTEVGCRKLEMRCRGAQIQCPVRPALMDCLAEFGEEKIAFPSGDILWPDREAAARRGLENIPERLAGVVVEEGQLDTLWPASTAEETPVPGEALNKRHPAPSDVLDGQSDLASPAANDGNEQAAAPGSTGSFNGPARPPGVSDSNWETYMQAVGLVPGFDRRRGEISKVARMVAQNSGSNVSGVRRALHRVLKVLRENN